MTSAHETAVATYLAEVGRQLATGAAAEHAYRPALQRLIESFGGNTAVNDPRRSEHGAPDFVFKSDKNAALTLGYAEAKDIDIKLDAVEKSEQMRRYAGYANLFLTNYLEFRFFRNGAKYQSFVIAERHGDKIVPLPQNAAELAREIEAFLGKPPEPITSGVRLAAVMGAKARRIRDNVLRFLTATKQSEKNDELLRMFDLIRELLVDDLDEESFADMYAQTLVYGLFAARYNDPSPDTFTREEARELVPASNPFLREFFDHIAGPRFDQRLAYIVDELCAVFAVSSVREIVHKHLVQPSLTGDPTDDKDPIIHFYEDFLKAYDPAQRKKMGAYYTPLPVVRFMVRMVDKILKEDFGLPDGLADTSKTRKKVVRGDKKVEYEFHKVQILDPAAGTATFLNEIVEFIHRGFEGQEGRWPSYVKDDLVPRLHGFELMMAPYTVAHLKLGLTLRESGVEDFGGRLGVYLTNTLEEGMDQPQNLFHFGLAEAVAQEAIRAGEIKNETPVMVVIGNPPYSGESANKTDFAARLVERYKVEPGGRSKLRERTAKWISDDYVKFLSFAEELVGRNEAGIVAMITNHGYLDNPTFRGMRWNLLQTFDRLHVMDLHGNLKKKESAPSGARDQNVFDIMQGVAILIGTVLPENVRKSENAQLFHTELWGDRAEKFRRLNANEVEWDVLEPAHPQFIFSPRDVGLEAEYQSGMAVTELFPVNGVGITTAHDDFVISQDAAMLERRFEEFKAAEPIADQLHDRFEVRRKKGWDILEGWANIQGRDPRDLIEPIAYRPFDTRYILYDDKLVWRTVRKIMQHFMKGPNVGLVAPRTIKESPGAFITQHLIGHKLFGAYDVNSVFPLYLYDEDGSRVPNIDLSSLGRLSANLLEQPTPELALDYCYAILHSPSYRAKFADQLKSDFPRIRLPANDREFKRLSGLGGELRELHLMSAPALNSALETSYPVLGSDVVERIGFGSGQVSINDTQHFGNVPEVAWNFYIGGYQPAQKWLKDRKGRKLSNDDIVHYQKIITVLTRTDEIMREIDEVSTPDDAAVTP